MSGGLELDHVCIALGGDTGDYSISDLAEVFDLSRPTVYRILPRIPSQKADSEKFES